MLRTFATLLRTYCACFCLLVSAPAAIAGLRQIAEITPTSSGSGSPMLGGIIFDGTSNPLVMDTLNSSLWRLDAQTGSRLSTTILPQAPGPVRSMAFDPATHTYYAADSYALYKIDSTLSTATRVGPLGRFFNFMDMAVDPTTGQLWLAADKKTPDSEYANGGSLWTVSTTTGAVTFQRTITGLPNPYGHTTALGIDSHGNFYINYLPSQHEVPCTLLKVNPVTGAATTITTTSQHDFVYLDHLAYDASSDLWLATNHDSWNGRYYLVEVTGVPEPSSLALLTLLASTLTLRRRSR